MIYLAWFLIASICAALAFRWVYMSYQLAVWQEVCVRYVIESGQHHTKVLEYIPTYPMYRILSELWQWDLRPYIKNQEAVQIILDFYAARDKMAQ